MLLILVITQITGTIQYSCEERCAQSPESGLVCSSIISRGRAAETGRPTSPSCACRCHDVVNHVRYSGGFEETGSLTQRRAVLQACFSPALALSGHLHPLWCNLNRTLYSAFSTTSSSPSSARTSAFDLGASLSMLLALALIFSPSEL